MSNCHSPSEPDGWAECAALPPACPPTHTHTHFKVEVEEVVVKEGVMAQLLWFLHPFICPADTQEEWIIYRNHFLSGSSYWCDSWPPKSIILSFVTLEKSRITAEYSHTLPMSSLCYPCYNKNNMANKSWATGDNETVSHLIANVTHFLSVIDSVVICITSTGLLFMCTGLRWHISWVCLMNPLSIWELQAGCEEGCFWKIVSCSLTDLEIQEGFGIWL